jgi:Autotransporter beta-domain
MRKLEAGAVLAMSTMLSGAAWGQDISTLASESSTLSPWGLPDTAAYGQTFTVGSATRLGNVVFRINDRGTAITYQMRVFAWDAANRRVVGPSLASTSGSSAGAAAMTSVSTNTSATLSGAGQYVVFLQATSNGSSIWGTAPGASYGGGDLVFQNNGGDTGQWSTVAWFVADDRFVSLDMAFALSFLPLLSGPTASEELQALLTATGGAARLVVLDAQGVARDLGQASIVARGDRLTIELVEATDGDEVAISTKSGTPGLVGNLYTWAQITGFDSEADEGPASINGTGFQIGADIAVGTDMVAGLSLGYSDINANDGTFSQDGSLTYLQPYLSYRSGQWHGNASLIFGQGDYDQTSDGGEGTGETELFAFTYEGGYDMAMKNGLIVTPMFGLIAGNEEAKGISGTLANAGSETYDFSQASLGARLTSRKPTGTYFAGLHADYLEQDAGTILTSEFLSENGWSGRVEFGGAADLQNGFGLSTTFDISGIGGSAQTLSGGLRVALQF